MWQQGLGLLPATFIGIYLITERYTKPNMLQEVTNMQFGEVTENACFNDISPSSSICICIFSF